MRQSRPLITEKGELVDQLKRKPRDTVPSTFHAHSDSTLLYQSQIAIAILMTMRAIRTNNAPLQGDAARHRCRTLRSPGDVTRAGRVREMRRTHLFHLQSCDLFLLSVTQRAGSWPRYCTASRNLRCVEASAEIWQAAGEA